MRANRIEAAQKRTHKKKELSTCASKNRYTDETQARAAAMASLELHEGCPALYIYRCKYCHGWHLTKRKGAKFFKVTAENPVF